VNDDLILSSVHQKIVVPEREHEAGGESERY
jgi:hypothetical protein